MNNQLMDVMQQNGDDFEMGGAQPFPFMNNFFGTPLPAEQAPLPAELQLPAIRE